MADILSTLRELRSLEEKRAHGTLSPEEEQRFQELQNTVSSRGPKPGPPTPAPTPSAAPVSATAVDTEPPFVDADLTEEMTEIRPEPGGAEATVVQAAPAFVQAPPGDMVPPLLDPPPQAGEEVLPPSETSIDALLSGIPLSEVSIPPANTVPSLLDPPLQGGDELLPPSETVPSLLAPQAGEEVLPTVEPPGPVPMSAAELRQWNASFTAPGAETPLNQAAPVPTEEAMPAAPEIPIPDVAEPTSVFAAPPEEPAPLAADWLAPTPLPLAIAALDVDLAPESTVIADDAPAVWIDPQADQGPPASTAHDDGWTVSAAWSAGIPPPAAVSEVESTVEPTPEPPGLVGSALSEDPSLAEGFEPPLGQPTGEVTSKKMTPIGESFAAGESRVVVHTLGGVQKRGSLVDAHMNADFLELRLASGEREQLSTASLKAVFFVVPIGQEVPRPVGDPVTVTLQDGHQLVGLSPDYQVGAVGFFLCPTDQRSRTAKIYIYAGAVKGIS